MEALIVWGALLFGLGSASLATWIATTARREAEKIADTFRAYKAANPEIVMPNISVDAEMRITGMDWDLGYVESGGSKTLAIPKIPRMGKQVIRMSAANSPPTYWELDFAEGAVRQIDEGEFAWRSNLPGGWNLN